MAHRPAVVGGRAEWQREDAGRVPLGGHKVVVMPGHFTHIYTARRVADLLADGQFVDWPRGVDVPYDPKTCGDAMRDWEKFTAVGATTRQGLISAPLRGRFGLVLRLNHYDENELSHIVVRSAHLLGIEVDQDGAQEIARRSRGPPRIANRLLRRVRDYAQVRAKGNVTLAVAQTALDLLEVDRYGLDEIDQKIMMTILEKYAGGPVGLNTISAAIGEEPSTIEEVYEPYLIQLGFIDRTPRGRIAMDRAFDYFKVRRRLRTGQPTLW